MGCLSIFGLYSVSKSAFLAWIADEREKETARRCRLQIYVPLQGGVASFSRAAGWNKELFEHSDQGDRALVSHRWIEPDRLAAWRRQYRSCGLVKIEDFFDPDVFEDLRREIQNLLPWVKRRDFTMRLYETPRRMSVVGGRKIAQESAKLAALYDSSPVVDFLSAIVGSRLFLSRQEDAFMTINHLEGHGDTQGWHVDDGSTAVIYAFSAPGSDEGGALEYIPNWPNVLTSLDASESRSIPSAIEAAIARGLVRSLHLAANAMYILKSDTALHRVAPLVNPSCSRTVVAAGYEARRVKTYSHTGSDLYAGA